MPGVFDEIAPAYTDLRESCPFSKYDVPAINKAVGDIFGLRVLDLACGSGFYTREIKAKGASTVVGVDISSSKIASAIKQEQFAPVGIEYQCADIVEYSHGSGASFDLVTASYLLSNAKSEEEVVAICGSAYNNLKSGGRFVQLARLFHESNVNDVKQYSVEFVPIQGNNIKGGVEMQTTMYSEDQSRSCSFGDVHWFKEVVIRSLNAAGFRSVEAAQVVAGHPEHVFSAVKYD